MLSTSLSESGYFSNLFIILIYPILTLIFSHLQPLCLNWCWYVASCPGTTGKKHTSSTQVAHKDHTALSASLRYP